MLIDSGRTTASLNHRTFQVDQVIAVGHISHGDWTARITHPFRGSYLLSLDGNALADAVQRVPTLKEAQRWRLRTSYDRHRWSEESHAAGSAWSGARSASLRNAAIFFLS
jgi:hypothetical protein